MTTILQLQQRVGRMLTDTDPLLGGYDEGLFYDAVSAALDAILPWVPKTATSTLTGDGSTYAFALPSDCYTIEGCVVDDTGELLAQAMLIPGYYRGDNLTATNDWLEYPHGYITFSKAVQSSKTYTLYYLAHWTKPVDESSLGDTLEPPEYTHYGLLLYTVACMLVPSSISTSEVRQFGTKVDSGNPEHNPMMQSSRYLLKLFSDEMNRHPKHQKAQR